MTRLTLFLSLLWRRIDDRCPDRIGWAAAWEVASIIYGPASQLNEDLNG